MQPRERKSALPPPPAHSRKITQNMIIDNPIMASLRLDPRLSAGLHAKGQNNQNYWAQEPIGRA